MNQLEVKNVNFQGNSLLAIQDKKTGKVFTAINNVLRGLGFDEKQIEYQRGKWVEDKAILKGTLKFSGTFLGMKTGKEAWCIDIMKLPLALAKINITPKIQCEMPELAERLEIYQDRCADTLANEFITKGSSISKQSKEDKQQVMLMNARSRMANTYLRLANVDTLSKEYKNILVTKASEVLAGEEILSLPKQEAITYSAGDIGKILGISSAKVGRIANANDMKTDEYGEYYRDKSRYSSKEVDTFRYNDNAIGKFKEILVMAGE